MTVLDRYASAVHSSNLKSKAETTYSDTDILGAAGFASKLVLHDGRPGAPLAMALARLFAGDNRAVHGIVRYLEAIAWGKAQADGVKLRREGAHRMACAVLAWHRDGTCKVCGGHGYRLVVGAPSLSENECQSCKGEGKVPFDAEFEPARLPIARWLLATVEREMAMAGPVAMAALAPRLEL